MSSLSVVMITKNEEAHIGRALASVRGFADEIIVVDSASTDATVEIAKRFADIVVDRPWEGYGRNKNMARDLATKEWILHIDADEEVSPELSQEIRAAIDNDGPDFYWLSIITEFLGQPLTHLQGKNLRVFRRFAGRWDGKVVHEQIERTSGTTVRLNDPDTGTLRIPLVHHSHYQTLAGYHERQERYAAADALEMRKTGVDRVGKPVRVNMRNPFSVARFLMERATKQFTRKFFRQRGFLDGWQGWVWCYVSAEYEYKMCKKYLRLTRKEQRP